LRVKSRRSAQGGGLLILHRGQRDAGVGLSNVRRSTAGADEQYQPKEPDDPT
jgi:hypothetical protein